MRVPPYQGILPLIAAAAAASLPTSSDAFDALNVLLGRKASGCAHSAIWQNGDEDRTAQICTHGTSLAIANTDKLINKTDCQTLIQSLDGKAGTGHWDIQRTCDGSAPNVLQSSQACGFALVQVSEDDENRITPQDVIGLINQAMEMFPDNETMSAVTGSTTCDNLESQIISWEVGAFGAASSAGVVQPRWSWLCLVGTLVAALSLARSV